MSGETEAQESGWTTDTLKAHYDQRFRDIEKSTDKALTAAEKATDKAEEAVTRRLEGLNELRAMATDAQAMFATREAVDTRFLSVEEKVRSLEQRIDTAGGRSLGVSSVWGYIIAAGAAGAAIVSALVLALR